MIRLSYPTQSVIYSVLTKSVGSGFRIRDDWHAPKHVQQKTFQRELTLLSLLTASSAAIQLMIRPVIRKHPGLKKTELVWCALATVPAQMFSEWFCRKQAPKPSWKKLTMQNFKQQQPYVAGSPAARLHLAPSASQEGLVSPFTQMDAYTKAKTHPTQQEPDDEDD